MMQRAVWRQHVLLLAWNVLAFCLRWLRRMQAWLERHIVGWGEENRFAFNDDGMMPEERAAVPAHWAELVRRSAPWLLRRSDAMPEVRQSPAGTTAPPRTAEERRLAAAVESELSRHAHTASSRYGSEMPGDTRVTDASAAEGILHSAESAPGQLPETDLPSSFSSSSAASVRNNTDQTVVTETTAKSSEGDAVPLAGRVGKDDRPDPAPQRIPRDTANVVEVAGHRVVRQRTGREVLRSVSQRTTHSGSTEDVYTAAANPSTAWQDGVAGEERRRPEIAGDESASAMHESQLSAVTLPSVAARHQTRRSGRVGEPAVLQWPTLPDEDVPSIDNDRQWPLLPSEGEEWAAHDNEDGRLTTQWNV